MAGMSMDRKPSIDRTLDLGLLRFAVCGLLFAWKTALVFLFTLLIIASRMGGCNASACRTYHTEHVGCCCCLLGNVGSGSMSVSVSSVACVLFVV